MDKAVLSKRSFDLLATIRKDFFAGAETTYSTDSLLLDILFSEFDCMESISVLLEKQRFEDCYILLRHVLETYLYSWLMIEGEMYFFTRRFTISPKEGDTPLKARDETLEKWQREKDSGSPSYADVKNIQKGKQEDTIIVTYQWRGLFDSTKPEDATRIVPWYVFAFQDYNPSKCFLSNLPSFIQSEPVQVRQIMKKQQEEQKNLYHHYFYINNIIRNLRLNKLITDDQREHIIVHYNFLSSFLHPNNRILRIKPSPFSYRYSERDPQIHSELILLYICKFQFLYLTKIVTYFKKHYSRGNYAEYEKQVSELERASRVLWFLDNNFEGYDVLVSKSKLWWLKRNDQPEIKTPFYYLDPLDRLRYLLPWKEKFERTE